MSTYIYAAIAQHAGHDAGHVCYGRTKAAARARALRQTTMSVKIKRERASAPEVDRLVQLGKLEREN